MRQFLFWFVIEKISSLQISFIIIDHHIEAEILIQDVEE